MAFPTISNTALLIQYLQQWQKQINKLGLNIITPQIPWNFTVASKQGGNQLTWNKVPVGDGYEVLMSDTGDFSTGVNIIQIPNVSFTAYFDPVSTSGGAAPAKRYYQVRATNGTSLQPHSVKGNATQALVSTAIAPNDTATASATNKDTSTNDISQANTRYGSYSGDFGGSNIA